MLQLPEGMANSNCQEELRNIGEVAASSRSEVAAVFSHN